MADPVLGPGQYSIGRAGSGTAYVYGGTSPITCANGILIQNTAVDPGSVNVQDTAVTGHDGMLFGVDTQPGMIVTQTGWTFTPGLPADALDSYSAFAGVWNDPTVRLADGAVQVLRVCYQGSSVTRRTYGRGRKIMPSYGSVHQGLIPFVAQFQSADNTWYADILSGLTLTSAPSFLGTITPPLTPPFQLAPAMNYQQNTLVNTGSLPTWPIITFTGPVSYPGLAFVNTPVQVGYTGSLKAADTLVIDTRPWVRTVMLNGTTSVAGYLAGDAMISMQLQPGSTLVRYTGQDYTGQSTCTVQWRNATLSIGGNY